MFNEFYYKLFLFFLLKTSPELPEIPPKKPKNIPPNLPKTSPKTPQHFPKTCRNLPKTTPKLSKIQVFFGGSCRMTNLRWGGVHKLRIS